MYCFSMAILIDSETAKELINFKLNSIQSKFKKK